MNHYKDKMGRYRTLSLFKETCMTPNLEPCFTLNEHDKNGLPSMRRLYIEIADPTEYKFAIQVLGSWDHWERLRECEWFKPVIAKWRNILDLKLKSEAIDALRATASMEGAKGTSAARWLAENGVDGQKRGRPTREEKAGYLKQAVLEDSSTEDEYRRLGLEEDGQQQDILH